MSLPDRLEVLRGQLALTGIDFIAVSDDQLTLDVYFHVEPSTLGVPLSSGLMAGDVRIESPDAEASLRAIPVTNLSWATLLGREVLRLGVAAPGDFVAYTLHIDDARIDPHYNGVAFRFQASCDSPFDCAPQAEICVEEAQPDVAIDYRARDFEGLRDALLEMAALRYPRWEERNAADLGVMLAEILAAVGDEHAYMQDRIAREAYLGTASRRRSLRRLGRLVDYELHEGVAASTWLELTVATSAVGGLTSVAAGADAWAEADDGGERVFEIGMGLAETLAGGSYALDRAINRLRVHAWDDEAPCLPAGATTLHVKGHHAARGWCAWSRSSTARIRCCSIQ